MYLGLDIGSSSSKAVLLGENQESLAAQVVNLGTGTKGVGQVLEAVYRQAGIGPEEVRYTVVTGYGRMTYQGADGKLRRSAATPKEFFTSPPLPEPLWMWAGKTPRSFVWGRMEAWRTSS